MAVGKGSMARASKAAAKKTEEKAVNPAAAPEEDAKKVKKVPEKETAAKKTADKQAPAKKTAEKKAPEKKPAAKTAAGRASKAAGTKKKTENAPKAARTVKIGDDMPIYYY